MGTKSMEMEKRLKRLKPRTTDCEKISQILMNKTNSEIASTENREWSEQLFNNISTSLKKAKKG